MFKKNERILCVVMAKWSTKIKNKNEKNPGEINKNKMVWKLENI